MKNTFLANPFKCAVSISCSVCFFLLSGSVFLIERTSSALIFLLLGLIFGAVAAICGAVVSVDQSGVNQTILGFGTKKLLWADIAKVGVIGTKAFNQHHPEKTGSLYIYFSQKPLSEEEHFEMMLKWPPLDKIYLIYDDKRIQLIQMLWNSEIQTYNVGNLSL